MVTLQLSRPQGEPGATHSHPPWRPGHPHGHQPGGNCLQRLTFDQAEQSEATEDGFQRIREVTGLTDVMDIVHKSRAKRRMRQGGRARGANSRGDRFVEVVGRAWLRLVGVNHG